MPKRGKNNSDELEEKDQIPEEKVSNFDNSEEETEDSDRLYWDEKGALIIKIDSEDDEEIESVKETPKKEKEPKKYDEERAKANELYIKSLKKQREDEDAEYAEAISDIEKYSTPKKKDWIHDAKSSQTFYERQSKSNQKRVDRLKESKPEQKRVCISNSTLKYIKKSDEGMDRKIANDYKKPQKRAKGPKYSFKPDMSLTLNSKVDEVIKHNLSEFDVEEKPRLSLINDYELINTVNAAKKSSLVTDSRLQVEPSDVGLELLTDKKATEKMAERAQKRIIKKMKEKKLAEKEPKEEVEEVPVQVHKAKKAPKSVQEMNSLFGLFKEK